MIRQNKNTNAKSPKCIDIGSYYTKMNESIPRTGSISQGIGQGGLAATSSGLHAIGFLGDRWRPIEIKTWANFRWRRCERVVLGAVGVCIFFFFFCFKGGETCLKFKWWRDSNVVCNAQLLLKPISFESFGEELKLVGRCLRTQPKNGKDSKTLVYRMGYIMWTEEFIIYGPTNLRLVRVCNKYTLTKQRILRNRLAVCILDFWKNTILCLS